MKYDSRSVVYTYDNVGNRSTMNLIQDDNQGFVTQTLVTYEYDANDRLTRSVSDTDPISYGAQDKFDRYYGGRPRGWTRPAVLAFGALCLTAFWAPLLPWRRIRARGASPRTKPSGSSALPLGHRARRKRLFTACVTTFLVPLMAVDPNAVQAMNTEALRVQTAITAGVLLDTDPTVTETTYTYDANGNQIGRHTTDPDSAPVSETYIFDAENRLVGYRKAIDGVLNYAASASYTYDADGIRDSRTVNDATTLYLTDKQQPHAQVLEERNAAGELIVRYTYGDDLISQHRLGGGLPTTRYFHYDGQMSTRQLTTDAPGTSVAITNRYAYDAYGLDLLEGPSPDNVYRYTGEQYDATIASYYLRARYYGYSVGRFLSADPLSGFEADPITLHKYLYANCNPINCSDPSGMMTLIEFQVSLTIIATLVGIVIGGIVRGWKGALLGGCLD